MSGGARDIAGVRAYVCAAEGPLIAAERDATDILGEVFGAQAQLVVIPVARLSPAFLDLKTRLAGEVLQKFVTYGLRVAIVGDISAAVAASGTLADFVRESNRGRSVWFVRDQVELEARLRTAA
jgi:hypothetical protein